MSKNNSGWFSPDGQVFLDLDRVVYCVWSEDDCGDTTLFVTLQGMEKDNIRDYELDVESGEALMDALSKRQAYPGYEYSGRED